MNGKKKKISSNFEVKEEFPEGKDPSSDFAKKEALNELEETLKEKIYETRDQITANYIAVFGIFASVIAFLLIQVQAFSAICNFERIVGISLITAALLLIFITALYFVISINKESKLNTFPILVVITVLVSCFFFGCLLLSGAGDEDVCKKTKLNEEFEKLENRLDKKEFEKYKEIEKRLEWLEEKTKIPE